MTVRVFAGIRFRALSPSLYLSETTGSFNCQLELRYQDGYWRLTDLGLGGYNDFDSLRAAIKWMAVVVEKRSGG